MLPPLYPIADMATLAARGVLLQDFVSGLLDGGAEIVQLRDKNGSPQQVLEHAEAVTKALAGSRCLPVMNDRADLAVLAGWRAVHVGHTDMRPEAVLQVLGAGAVPPLIGVSTHNDVQVIAADASPANYIAVGPVFLTGTKADAEPVIGVDGVRRARSLTRKPIVAIGGITLENAPSVLEAGADSVAVIGGLFRPGRSLEANVRDFLRRLR